MREGGAAEHSGVGVFLLPAAAVVVECRHDEVTFESLTVMIVGITNDDGQLGAVWEAF